MKYLKFMAAGLALLFVFSTSFTKKKVLYPECKYSVTMVTGVGTGYIQFKGANITGQTQGVDYNCLNNRLQTCTITTDCRQVLELFNDEFLVVGWYDKTSGEFQ